MPIIDVVETIFQKIISLARYDYLAYYHSLRGINTRDIIDVVKELYNSEVIPVIDTLSSDDKLRLLPKLEVLDAFSESNTDLFKNVISYINDSMNKGKK